MKAIALALVLALSGIAGGIAGLAMRPKAVAEQPFVVPEMPKQAAMDCTACRAQYTPLASCMPAGLPRSCWQCWQADAIAAGLFPGGLQWFDWMKSPVDGSPGWFAGFPSGQWYHWMRPAANAPPDWIGVPPSQEWTDLPPLPVPPPPVPGNFSARWKWTPNASGMYLTPAPACP